jgi:hypothetical protein
LLDIFEENQIGMHIMPILCGVQTVTDDVTLISNDPRELQTMLDIQSHHLNKLRYQINEQKIGPIRNPRWEQKRTAGYVIVSRNIQFS